MAKKETLEEKIERVESLIQGEDVRVRNEKLEFENKRLKARLQQEGNKLGRVLEEQQRNTDHSMLNGVDIFVSGIFSAFGDVFSELWNIFGNRTTLATIVVGSFVYFGSGGLKSCESVAPSYVSSNIQTTVQGYIQSLNKNNREGLKDYILCREINGTIDTDKANLTFTDQQLNSDDQIKISSGKNAIVITSQDGDKYSIRTIFDITNPSGNRNYVVGNAKLTCTDKCRFIVEKNKCPDYTTVIQ